MSSVSGPRHGFEPLPTLSTVVYWSWPPNKCLSLAPKPFNAPVRTDADSHAKNGYREGALAAGVRRERGTEGTAEIIMQVSSMPHAFRWMRTPQRSARVMYAGGIRMSTHVATDLLASYSIVR